MSHVAPTPGTPAPSTPGWHRTPADRARITRAVLALALGAFAIGITEFSMMGLLTEAAEDLGVGLTSAGWLVTAYALGAVVGGPLLSVTLAGIERRRLVLAMMALFAAGHLMSFLATSLPVLLAGRFLSGLPHGAYLATAALIVARLAGPTKRAQAAAWVLSGLTVANVAGVPVVTWMGQLFGWRWMFLAAMIVALGTMAAVLVSVPRQEVEQVSTWRNELSAFRSSRLWWAILLAVVGFCGMFALYAYIAPVMTQVAGLPQAALPIVLALYGVGMVVGTVIGGRAADRSVLGTIRVALTVLATSLALFAAFASVLPVAVLLVVLVGMSGSALAPALQTHLVDCAPNAPQIASALTHSAFNLANALGAWLGGMVIAQGLGLRAPALTGATAAVLGIGVVLVMTQLGRRVPAPVS